MSDEVKALGVAVSSNKKKLPEGFADEVLFAVRNEIADRWWHVVKGGMLSQQPPATDEKIAEARRTMMAIATHLKASDASSIARYGIKFSLPDTAMKICPAYSSLFDGIARAEGKGRTFSCDRDVSPYEIFLFGQTMQELIAGINSGMSPRNNFAWDVATPAKTAEISTAVAKLEGVTFAEVVKARKDVVDEELLAKMQVALGYEMYRRGIDPQDFTIKIGSMDTTPRPMVRVEVEVSAGAPETVGQVWSDVLKDFNKPVPEYTRLPGNKGYKHNTFKASEAQLKGLPKTMILSAETVEGLIEGFNLAIKDKKQHVDAAPYKAETRSAAAAR